MSPDEKCVICESKKGLQKCGLCGKFSCKAHVHDLGPEAFAFLNPIPPDLAVRLYCPDCFDEKVAKPLNDYEVLFEKAKEIYFLTSDYPGYIRVLKRHSRKVIIPECDDRRETIMRMAFVAAELGMNAIIEAKVEANKVTSKKYRTHKWSGTAMPAIIDGDQLERTSLKRL